MKTEKPIVANNNLHEAIVEVMKEVKNIDKNMNVGSGNYGYKGVADKDVKQYIGQAMAKNGLTCVPIKIEPTVSVDRWTDGNKQKQSVFVEVLATYQVTHSATGESIQIMGYGHGQDSNDKAAGKATTYALKNALLYSFLVPTGHIEDTDTTHSEETEKPKKASKPTLTKERFANAVEAIKTGSFTITQLEEKYSLTTAQNKELEKLV